MKNLNETKKFFKNKDLLDQALTHRSWINEHPGQRSSNERLEFLGDAVLEFIVSKELYETFPNREEGYLTVLRANLVNTQSLAEVAKRLNLGESLYLSKGEEEGGGRNNSSLLADTVEAIIGALFLEGGTNASYKFIKQTLLDNLSQMTEASLKDPKSKLQELVQSQGFSTPKYKVIQESGPDHDKKFIVQVVINNKPFGSGKGRSKSEAEQKAAEVALRKNI